MSGMALICVAVQGQTADKSRFLHLQG